MERKAELNLVVGINGTGKTTWIEDNIVNTGRKCLIVTPDSYEWDKIPTISIKDIRTFVGVAKLIYENGIIEKIKNNYFGGYLVLDDAMSYLKNQTSEELRALYIRRRQQGIDIYIIAHGLKQLPPQLFSFATWLILFNSTENFSLRKKEIVEETFNKIIKAQLLISKKVMQGHPYYYKRILLDQQVRGNYVAEKQNKR